ncbi:protein GVQW3-like [Phlebotomus argentipes]|uniref:protein GVQW3-like n=1 Tax=Phlebotomus argentipes TaxID=94469 RepID=UPI0028931E85|nr:protein GVQW3-like [Phlebotomus argentipes]
MPKDKVEQRINLKFLAKLKHTGKESYDMLKEVYGDDCMSRSQAFEWHKRFRDGQEEVTDIERPGRPTTVTDEENVEKVKQIIQENPNLSIRAIAKILGITNGSVQRIVREKI